MMGYLKPGCCFDGGRFGWAEREDGNGYNRFFIGG